MLLVIIRVLIQKQNEKRACLCVCFSDTLRQRFLDQSEKNKKGKVPLRTNLNCDFLKLKINFTMHWGLGRVGGRDVCGREGLAFPKFLFHLDIFYWQ